MNNGYFGLGGRLAVLAIAGGFGLSGGCRGGGVYTNYGAPKLEPSNLPANEKFTQPDACTYDADFGQVAVGSSGALQLDLSDTGSSPLQILTVAPPSDAEFSSDLSAGTTVQPGLSTTVNLAFKPFSEGAKTAAFTFGTDSDACPMGVTVNMTGTGVILKLVASPQAVNFGQVVVHSSPGQMVTLTNSSNLDIGVTPTAIGGPQASLFSVPDKPAGVQFNVPANQSVQMNVIYSPLAPSELDSANLTLALTAGGSIPITMQGTALQSGLKITPTPLNFAFVQPGDSVTLPLHLANVGNETLTVTSVSVVDPGTPASFSIANNSWRGGQLAPGTSQDVNVTFSPSILAQFTGELDVSSTDSTNIVPVTLQGFGGGAIINCGTPPLALDFGTVAVGIGASLPVICTNVGTDVPNHPEAGVILSTLATNSTVFSAQVDPNSLDTASATQPLAAGHSVQIDAIYTPTQTAMDTGTLKINSNVTDNTQVAPPTVALSGNAIFELPCTYSITPQAVQFGEVRPNTTVTGGFTINNLGPNECLVTGLGLGADTQTAFTLLSGTVTSQRLSPPGVAGTQYPTSLQVNIQFAPKQSGSYSGSVRFTISDPTAPYQTVNLSGVGGNSCFLIQPAELDFGTVGVSNGQFCSNGKKKFVGINSCAQPVTIQSATVGGSPAFVFVSETTPQVVAQGATSTPFVVGFKPMMQGTSDGNVLVQTDLQTTPFGVGLAGSAVNGNTQLDKFAGHTPAVDVLLIMDSDDDLEDLRQPFAMHVGDFVMAAETLGLDFQFGVTSTSDCPTAQPNGEQGKLVPCPNCNINGAAPTIVTNADPNAATDLSTLVLLNNVEEDGCPVIADDEHFFDVAYKALVANAAAYNAGFVREDAYLAVIQTNGDNEDEQDPQTPQWYANQFLSVKGADHPELFSWSYINPSEYGAPGGHQPFNNLPERIKSMLNTVGGVALDMYQTNWWKGVVDLWNIVLQSSTRFPLSGTPDPNSIVIYLDGPPPLLTPPGGTPGVEILANNPNGSSNWSYDATSNTIVVNSANLTLSSSDTLYAEYTLVCP
jgi:hypothetical protein